MCGSATAAVTVTVKRYCVQSLCCIRHREKLLHRPECGNSVFPYPSVVCVVCNICICNISRNRFVHCSFALAHVDTKCKSMYMLRAVPNSLQCIRPRFKKVALE